MLNYKTAGVDVVAGKEFVSTIETDVKSTHRSEVIGKYGGFNGMTRIPKGYKNPVLVSGADGVGTKVKLARTMSHDGTFGYNRNIGIDLVAMCVNDVITSGAEPLYFLDYISTGKLNQESLQYYIEGIVEGCKLSGCSLIGGETAEHPVIVGSTPLDDLAGFCTGVVEEELIVDGSSICAGDVIIAIPSSGLHSNGFSLINRMLFHQVIYLRDHLELLTPTRIYAKEVRSVPGLVEGMVHITGGGLPDNLPRVLPEGRRVRIDYRSWEIPDIFQMIQKAGELNDAEMFHTFNMGIGFCMIVKDYYVDRVCQTITDSWVMGEVL
jgi:phosphoribosylformylglycinamidine cyclo-ligase